MEEGRHRDLAHSGYTVHGLNLDFSISGKSECAIGFTLLGESIKSPILTRSQYSMDAGYTDSTLIATIRELGFGKVLAGAKSSFILRPGRSKKAEAPLKDLLGRGHMNREPGWGCKERVGFSKGTSPTFGKVKVCARIMLGKVRYVFAFGIDRAPEIVRVWQSHHWVEEFFKRMKHLLSLGSYRLKGTSGAYS